MLTDVIWVQPAPSRRARLVRWSATAVLLALASLAAACGGGSSGPTSAESPTASTTPAAPNPAATLEATSGGLRLSLAIPEGALPRGVAASDITIEALAVETVAQRYPNADVLAAYRFGPDGLEFDAPLEATIVFADQQAGVIAALTSADGTSEQLDPVEGRIRPAGGPTTLVYAIEHFSEFTVVISKDSQPSRVTFLPPLPEPMYAVGESFTVRARIDPGYNNWSEVEQSNDHIRRSEYRTLRDRGWSAALLWTANATADLDLVEQVYDLLAWREDKLGATPRNVPPLEPQRVEVTVDGASGLVGEFAEQTFTCRRVGDFSIYLYARVTTRAERTMTVDGGEPRVTAYPQHLYPGWASPLVGRCVDVATATPPPTASPTGTAAPTASPSPPATATAPPAPDGVTTHIDGFDVTYVGPLTLATGGVVSMSFHVVGSNGQPGSGMFFVTLGDPPTDGNASHGSGVLRADGTITILLPVTWPSGVTTQLWFSYRDRVYPITPVRITN